MESYKQEFENIIIHTKQLKLKYMGDYESEEESDEQSQDGKPHKKIKLQKVESPPPVDLVDVALKIKQDPIDQPLI